MSKLLKIVFRTIGISLEWVLIAVIFFLFAIRTSPFQTFLAKKAASYFSKEWNTTVAIDKVDIYFFDKLALDGFLLLDQSKDTLASLETLDLELKDYSLDQKWVEIEQVRLKNGKVHVYKDKKQQFNFQFLSDYFASSDTTKSEPFQLSLNQLKLEQIDLKYNDFTKEFSPFGLDFNHLHFKQLYLTTSDILLDKNGGISTFIKHLSFYEKSSFDLNSLSGKISFNDKGLKTKFLRIRTSRTQLNIAHLDLNVNELTDFSKFNDKVNFDIDLKKSLVSFKDIALIVPSLEGMKDKVLVEAKVSNTLKNLKIADLNLRIGRKSLLKGTFYLPDFENIESSFLNEKLNYAVLNVNDLEQIYLPKSAGNQHVNLGDQMRLLKQITIKDLRVDGMMSNFVVKADRIQTALGSIEMDHGIMIAENKLNDSYEFQKSLDSEYDVKIDSFLLGKFIGNSDIGALDGSFFLEGEVFKNGKFDLNKINGDLSRFDYLNYAYSDISIKDGSFRDNVFVGKMEIADDNLNLLYTGTLDLNKKQHFKFDIDISEAILDNLNLSNVDRTMLRSAFSVDISGTNPNNYSGEIELKGLFYREGDQTFDIPSMVISMNRSELKDVLSVSSKLGSILVSGKVDYETILTDLNNQFNSILPAIFKYQKVKRKSAKSNFTYEINVGDVDDFLKIFVPGLELAKGTKVKGYFDGQKVDFSLDVTSNEIKYDQILVKDLTVFQKVNKQQLLADYSVSNFSMGDSLFVSNANFTATGTKDEIISKLMWNPSTKNETFFSWKTIVNDINSYFFNIYPSYFSIKEHRWDIVDNSQILLAPNDIQIQNFKMERKNQYLTIDGCISEKDEDILKLDIHDLELEDFASLFAPDINIKGELNAVATVADPFKDVQFSSDAMIRDLNFDNAEIGDINLKGAWGKKTQSLDLSGELYYKKTKTFNFDGKYYLERDDNNLDFNLDFDYTDIQFANAFMDPSVVSGIRGLVDGKLHIGGSSNFETDKNGNIIGGGPIVEGEINLLGGNAKVEMFGVNFGFSGEIAADKDGFYINNMPVMDEEGNTGSLVGTIFHNNFADWSMDLFFNLVDDAFAAKHGNPNQELDQFLVLNTAYKEGELYYGKAYAKGTANIFGYADNLQIDVNMTTKKGTEINFPMYGASEIEENNFLTFKPKGQQTKPEKHEIDFTGVSMNLKFNVTPDAQMKVIFDPSIEDEITAFGRGDFTIKMNELGDLDMRGEYTIAENSVYNFVFPPVKEKFHIKEGGTITWTGDPIDAKLNLETYNVVKTTFKEILPNLESSHAAEPRNVECYLTLSESLVSPLIKFDIRSPQSNDAERAALENVKLTPEELNKQFFSLLLVKRFQPLQGTSVGAGAALDIVSGQIEDMLNSMSNDVRINVGLRNSTNSNEASVGFEKALLNDRLVIKTSLGVENSSETGESTNSFIGDVNIDYLVNKEGTFRVSIFNESNDNTVIQEKNLGLFTQGAGLHYQEEFNNFQDFKMVQYLLDLFRKKKKYPIKKKRKQTKVPPLEGKSAVKPEE